MGELLTFSQASLLLLPKAQLQYPRRLCNPNALHNSFAPPMPFLATKSMSSPTVAIQKKAFSGIKASVISDSKAPTTFTADSAGSGFDMLEDTGGSGGDFGNSSGGGGGGGGDDDGGDGNTNEGEDSGESKDENVKTGMSMSQKLTLSYALLIGVGGVMGFLKSGSNKSLLAGGLSASLLLFVYTVLPSNPFLASSIGLGLSAALLVVMGSRFKRSGKIFPAGVVSFVSLIMSGGYLHGILRSLH